jgi:hypothetical protein
MSRWNNEEIDKATNLLKQGLSYCEIANALSRTRKSVKEKLSKSGLRATDFKAPREIKKCLNCGENILGFGISYCSSSCAAKVNNILYPKRTPVNDSQTEEHNKRVRNPKKENFCLYCNNTCKNKYCSLVCQRNFNKDIKIKNWQNGNDLGYSGKTKQLKRFIRNFLLEKNHYKCHKCGWNERNPVTGTIPLEVNHIDGDAENCKEENLEIICPNCHSLTHNFRALNKNSKRNRKAPCET